VQKIVRADNELNAERPPDRYRSIRMSAYPADRTVFERTQSRAFADTPWGNRLKPIHSWSEMGGYGVTFGLVAVCGLALAYAAA
jgi:hypothetical protein